MMTSVQIHREVFLTNCYTNYWFWSYFEVKYVFTLNLQITEAVCNFISDICIVLEHVLKKTIDNNRTSRHSNNLSWLLRV